MTRAMFVSLTACLLAACLPMAAPASGRHAARGMAVRDIVARLPDGRALHFRCAGRGAATVLLEAGWSADAGAWPKLMPLLAARSRVCAYDRAGAGSSDPGPGPRDGAAIARDLDDGLRAARIAGPYVLVGHSSGGLYVRHFAKRRPADVVGMVLADPTVAHQQRRLQAAFGPGAGSLAGLIARSGECLAVARVDPSPPANSPLARCRVDPAGAAVGRWQARLSELETLFGSTSADLDGARLGSMPLIVLTAATTYAAPAAGVWAALHRELAALSDAGEARVIARSGHLMMKDRPDAIADAVADVIARAAAARVARPAR